MRDSQRPPRRSPFGLLARWLRRPAPRSRPRPPDFEALEDRAVPAVVHPTVLLPVGVGQAGPLNRGGPYGYAPAQVRHAYGFDQITFGSVTGDGSGQTIAVVDAGSDPTLANDLHQFDLQYGLPDPTLIQVNQFGGSTPPGVADAPGDDWTLEISLDVEWAHATAPGATILYVAANTADDGNLFAAVRYAATTGGASVVSMSWGDSEVSTESNNDFNFTAPGVTYVGASGDSGSPPIYPAVSPNVLSVGATTLTLNGDNSYAGESAWVSSGGGVSAYESQPPYQQGVRISNGNLGGTLSANGKRTTPDVAIVGDPSTGVSVYDSYDYPTSAPWVRVGGTSAGAPQWSALIAIADQGRALNNLPTLSGASQTLPWLYAFSSSDFHDVTIGSTISTSSPQGPPYGAGPGYDLTTGLGSPVANALAAQLATYAPGPRVVAATPVTDGQGGVTGVAFTFNEAIARSTFTAAAVDGLSGPGGAITPTGVTMLSATQYEVTFADQTAAGNYGITIGPSIKDLGGLPMDQNGNNVSGEATDSYATTFGLPLPAALPAQENFSDGVAHGFVSQSGSWAVQNGSYQAAPAFAGGDAVSTLTVSGSLPANLQFNVTMSATAAAGGFYSNGFVIFDYQSPTNFKFAGAFVGNHQWVIGHRDANGWEIDAVNSDPTIAAGTQFNLQLWLQGANADLCVNGAGKVSFNYGSAFTGSLGLGAENSLTQFTNLNVQQMTAGTLPMAENFADGQAHYFVPQEGAWSVGNGSYGAAPLNGGDAVSTLLISGSPSSGLQVGVTMSAAPAAGGFYSNGFVVFDYQSPTSFKFAGAFVGLQAWVVGHRDATGWHIDAATSDPTIAAGVNFGLQLYLQGGEAILAVNGVTEVNTTYATGFTGSLGLGSENSLTQFTNLSVQQLSAATLPIAENFSDGQAHYFIPQSGGWAVSNGRYGAAPAVAGGDAVSTLLVSGALPSSLEFDATMNAAPAGGGLYSNGFLIFDYQSPTNFKFAGAFVGLQEWVIGHRDATGWHIDAAAGDAGIAPGADYGLQLLLQGTSASLLVGGAGKVSFSYASAFTGALGFGTQNSSTQFGNLFVQQSGS